MNSDFKELLKIFSEEKVKYMIIGGYAVAKHAEPRYTKDLDIWISNSRNNAERIYQALSKFGSPLADITIEDFTVPTLVYQIGIEPSRIDIIMGLENLDFGECWENKETVQLGEVETYFISIDDLIKSKEFAGRPQDLMNVANLNLKKKEHSKVKKDLPESNE